MNRTLHMSLAALLIATPIMALAPPAAAEHVNGCNDTAVLGISHMNALACELKAPLCENDSGQCTFEWKIDIDVGGAWTFGFLSAVASIRVCPDWYQSPDIWTGAGPSVPHPCDEIIIQCVGDTSCAGATTAEIPPQVGDDHYLLCESSSQAPELKNLFGVPVDTWAYGGYGTMNCRVEAL